jgi:hypothetical protein
MTDPLWDFDKISEERIQFLKAPFEFGTLISRIQTEAQNVRYKKDKGTHEAKEAWRPMFCFDVSEKTFDCFFNSPYGYRGQFLVDPEEGKRKNVQLVSALIDTLVGAGCCPIIGFATRKNMDR